MLEKFIGAFLNPVGTSLTNLYGLWNCYKISNEAYDSDSRSKKAIGSPGS